ncbi:MAG: molybdopterin molybdotransferase MoeA [Drouetiella hepatica Uher 2000/2452]|uniref:Molybdopterin molybdenumtransferase n=1 Tax=Drouetiella hepatica Uher 2000/2452 TaxID=904376 RepID=A0A951UL03_9CYAN|nr:molybdopterin molybdotransferase MoeA [Drouetiella hepatica Uher 2000/2452]
MLPAQQAEALILDLVQPLDPQRDSETIALEFANGRILAAAVSGASDVPHWDNSAMDGYAVRYADVKDCDPQQPVTLEIIEEIPAGYQPQKIVQSGQAARILTGSMMPAGADTIVIQEDTRREGDRVTLTTAPKPNAFVRHQGEFYQAGNPLLPLGIRLSAPEMAVLATAQCMQVPVFRRPRVAILSTGNELVSPDQSLQPGQIVDSNQYALAALVANAGAEPICLGIVPDRPEELKEAIAQAIALADLVISSGGVSVGDYDYVDRILAELGAEIHIRAVAVKPGKPLTVATFARTELATAELPSALYFGLPGNPVSALVTFWRFVLPALRKLSGLSSSWRPLFVKGRSQQDLLSDGKRESYLWGQTYLVDGSYEFHLAGGSSSSGNLINLAQTNSLAVLPVGETFKATGETIQIMLVDLPMN